MKGYPLGNTSLIEFDLTGNITPPTWFQHLRRENGKPHTTAIQLLADIAYWYRPMEIRDEATGALLEYRKKFKADKLQRSYQSFSSQFGFTKKQTRDAIQFLVDQGVITKELRNISADDGTPLNNVLFLEVVLDRLKGITYSTREGDAYKLIE